MHWDENLARLAENWARQCKFEHDLKKNRALKQHISVGQNLFKINHKDWRKKDVIQTAIETWFQGYMYLSTNKLFHYYYYPNIYQASYYFANMILAPTDRVE